MRNIHQHVQVNATKAQRARRFVSLFAIGLLLVGFFFRFANLDGKVYGHDETLTSMKVAGFTYADILEQLFNGHEVGVEHLQTYQQVNPEKGFMDMVSALRKDDPQHMPLYFIMARLWAQWFGSSVEVMRSLPALISLFVFPCIYWLCQELFGSPMVGRIAVALIAISPFHVLYAQEARPYSLFTVAIVLSSAALLRAVRVQTKLGWGVYAAAVAFSLYAYLLTILVLIGHGIYIILMGRTYWHKNLKSYAFSMLLGIVLLIPWLFNLMTHFSTVEEAAASSFVGIPMISLIKAWAGYFSRVFVDFGRTAYHIDIFKLGDDPILIYLIPFTFSLILLSTYALYFLHRTTSRTVWVFIMILVGFTSLPLVLIDLMTGRSMSASSRYLIPTYVGLQLAIAYLLTSQLLSIPTTIWRRKFWQLVAVVLALNSVISCALMFRAESWWNHINVYYNPQVARILNETMSPLLISEGSEGGVGRVLSLSYLLNSKVRFCLASRTAPKISDAYSEVFVYKPSEVLRNELERTYRLEPIFEAGGLWRLEQQPESDLPK